MNDDNPSAPPRPAKPQPQGRPRPVAAAIGAEIIYEGLSEANAAAGLRTRDPRTKPTEPTEFEIVRTEGPRRKAGTIGMADLMAAVLVVGALALFLAMLLRTD